jgi:arylsulfatase A-like enzyme/Flp pilus assembly protein TadD
MARRKRDRGGERAPAGPLAAGAGPRRPPRIAAGLALVAVVAGLAALVTRWRGRPPRSDTEARARLARLSPKGPFNVVVVTLDTTRADRLGCYGFKGVETPNLDALCRDGVVFDNATAVVPLTFPSHSSIFTGLLPPHHGVRDNGGFFLEDGRTTLAERMKEAGYSTGAFIAAWVLESRWGLAQGFQHYDDHFQLSKYKIVSLGTVQKPGDEVMDEALQWLETAKSGRYLAWVHLYDPHAPYEAPEPFASRYARSPYLGEIAYTDKVFGRLMSWLRDKGQLDRTIVMVTGDHGESLGEHGEASHAYFIYGSTTHVPLIVRTPWGLTGRRAARVSGVDIMPTVLDLVGLPPQEGIDGRSLARLLFDPDARLDRPSYSESYFPRFHYGWQQLRALRDDRYTYIDAPEPELYDLQEDPGETRNVFKAFSARAEPLRLALEALAKVGAQSPERRSLDPETLQRLAALGYVGNVIDVDPHAVLPDPKAKLPLFQMMNVAKDLAQNDRVEDAVARMRQVVAADPRIMDAHLTLGNWLVRLKRGDEAVAAFKQALALKPDDDIALGNLARLYLSRGRRQDALDALEVFRTALHANPKNPQSWYQLAALYLDTGRFDEAESAFRDALVANPRMGAAYNGLGVIAFTRGDLGKAEELVRKGLALEPGLRTAHYNLGRIREARSDVAGAEVLYRAELEAYPDHGRAWFNLAQIRRARGDRDGYLAELRQGIEKAPDFGACYWYLAREELGAGHLDAAADLARRGLEAQPVSDVAPLGHYVLADVYNRQGQAGKAQEEVGKAQRLEVALRKNPIPRI